MLRRSPRTKRTDTIVPNTTLCRAGEGATDAHVECGDRVERYPRRVLAELDQLRAQLRLPGIGAAEHQARRRARVVRIVEFDQRGVDSVGAGAGDQAEVEVGWHADRKSTRLNSSH